MKFLLDGYSDYVARMRSETCRGKYSTQLGLWEIRDFLMLRKGGERKEQEGNGRNKREKGVKERITMGEYNHVIMDQSSKRIFTK